MSKYRVETAKGTYEVETEDNPKTGEGLAQNAINDVGDIATGLGSSVKKGAFDLPLDLTSSLAQKVGDVVTGGDSGQTPIGKEITDFGNNSPEMGKQMIAPIAHPLDYAYQHPVSQALNIAGLGEGLTGAVGEAAETGAKYAGRFGENQMGKLHGTSLPQFRQLGRENFGPAMRASYGMGDADLSMGPIAREQAINERMAQLGSDIGDIRDQASQAGPSLSPQEMADKIKANLSPDYSAGGKNFEEENALNKQLENISQMKESDPSAYAQRATELHKNAAGTKLVLPNSSAENDVANQLSSINDDTIKSRLPADISDQYDALKDQFHNTAPLQPMELRGQAKEALGKGQNTAFGAVKDLAHTMIGGPKMGAKIGFGAESVLESTAKAAPYSSMGALTSHIMSKIQEDPRSLGQFAQPLMKAAQDGGSQGIAAMHYILSSTNPEYSKMMQGD